MGGNPGEELWKKAGLLRMCTFSSLYVMVAGVWFECYRGVAMNSSADDERLLKSCRKIR
jgi:hypothetical protein